MLDTSIPLGVKNIEIPDIAAATQNRLQNQNLRKQGKMSDLLLANAQRDEAKAVESDKKARTMQGLLQINTEIGQDGRPTLNKQRMVSDLNRLGFSSEALDMQKATDAESKAARDAKRAEYKERLGLRERVLADHSPENYAGKLSLLKSFGDDLEDLPPQYNPDAVNNSLKQVMTLKERMEQAGKDSDRKDAQSKQTAQEKKDAAAALLAEKRAAEDARHNLATEGIQRIAAGNKPPDNNLPLDVKEQIKELSSKNASKIAIKNQIDNSLAQLKLAKDDDTKVRIGRGMLKILNSTEGADAIGAEESKRLGDALEYNIFDVSAGLGMKPGKLHGRDLAGFLTQAQAVSDAIGGSVKANQSEVDRLYGRKAAQPAAPTPAAPISSLKPNQDGSFDYVPGGINDPR